VEGTPAAGTLKVLDGTTLQPLWGSAAASGSYNLAPAGSAKGQAPVYFGDGTIAAGDNQYYVRYAASGAVLAKAPLQGTGTNFGMTPLSSVYGVVSQSNGTLTLLNLSTWKAVSHLKLLDPVSNEPVALASPSSGAPNVLYAVGYTKKSRTGWLFSIGVDTTTHKLVVNSSFEFQGLAGASPVVVLPSASGLENRLVLLPTPGLTGEPTGQNYLTALEDVPGSGLELLWSIPLAQGLLVSPCVDSISGSLFYNVPGTPVLNQASLATGQAIAAFNIQEIGGFGGEFQLSGHIGASIANNVTTLLLGAIDTPAGEPSTQYALAFQPAAPSALLWSQPLDTTTVAIGSNQSSPNVYTAAWNLVPSQQSGVACPVIVSVEGDNASTIVRLCDH
jgi:hypothetical protein